MKIVHQLNGQSSEREVADGFPIGFFIANKQGGAMSYNAKDDHIKLFMHNGTTINLMRLRTGGVLTRAVHKGDSLELTHIDDEDARVTTTHEFFVPYFMDALIISAKDGAPIELVLDPKELRGGRPLTVKSIAENEGRVLIGIDDGLSGLNIAIQGNGLKYAKNTEAGRPVLCISSGKTAIAAATTAGQAMTNASYLATYSQKIRELQLNYMSGTFKTDNPEKGIAYACVLNGTDNMFLSAGTDTANSSGEASPSKTAVPLPYFSNVSDTYVAIAMNSLMLEGEFRRAKDTLMAHIDSIFTRAAQAQGIVHIESAVWPALMLGRLLNKLCMSDKLYSYFTPAELTMLRTKLDNLIDVINHNYRQEGLICDVLGKVQLEAQSMMLSLYDLAHALTQSDKHRNAEVALRFRTRKMLLEHIRTQAPHDLIRSMFLSAYIYPKLLSNEEWKALFDGLLDQIHNDFRSMRMKINSTRRELALDLFGLSCLAAIVMYTIDKDHYGRQIKSIHDKAVTEVLYKGIIGRPSYSYSVDLDVEKQFIRDEHMLNNAMFLEMLRHTG